MPSFSSHCPLLVHMFRRDLEVCRFQQLCTIFEFSGPYFKEYSCGEKYLMYSWAICTWKCINGKIVYLVKSSKFSCRGTLFLCRATHNCLLNIFFSNSCLVCWSTRFLSNLLMLNPIKVIVCWSGLKKRYGWGLLNKK